MARGPDGPGDRLANSAEILDPLIGTLHVSGLGMAGVLQLARVLDVKSVSAALAQARRACASNVEIDATEVKSIDSAGAQLLFAIATACDTRAAWRLSAELERELLSMGLSLSHFHRATP